MLSGDGFAGVGRSVYDAAAVMTLRLVPIALLAALVLPPQEPEFKDPGALLAALPAASVKPLDAQSALLFSALPLTCVDDLQPRPSATRPYFWQPTYRTVDSYDKTRAFYGCSDWSTAVSATWTLVALLKAYPDLASGQLVREKLTSHLGRENLEGELAYFRAAGGAQRPYGYAWFLRLYADLATWKDPDGVRYAENATALSRFFDDGIVGYLVDLVRPNRMGNQTNSALTLNLLLDYVDSTRDMTIKRAVSDAARRLFQADTNCATETEAASPEMVSPCLEEAAVMSRVLDPAAFMPWFDQFLPPAESPQFKPLRTISFDVVGGRGRGGNRGGGASARGAGAAPGGAGATPRGAGASAAPSGTAAANGPPTPNGQPAPPAGSPESANADAAPGPRGRGGAQTNPRANWIGLAFTRASAYSRLAAALPAGDPRVAVFRRLADIHAQQGQQEVVTTAAFDAPWVGALAVSYLLSAGGSR